MTDDYGRCMGEVDGLADVVAALEAAHATAGNGTGRHPGQPLVVDGGPRWKAVWPRFSAELQARLDQGHRDYGDVSFACEPLELIKELQQEVLDLAGWGLVLWDRLRRMEQAMMKDAEGIPWEKHNR